MLALSAVALLSCRAPTQITFEVSTDIACAEHGGTNLNVGRLAEIDGRPVGSSRLACDPATGRIGSVVIVPSGDDDEEVAVRFVLGIGKSAERCVEDGLKGGCIVARRGLRFIPHEPLVVAVPMRNECRDVECPAGQTCVRGGCVGAEIKSPGDCTGDGCGEEAVAPSSAGDAGAAGDAGGEAGAVGKRVFLSSAVYTANLGGAAGADVKCQGLADAAKLGGTYRAWISDATSSPSTRFTKSGPYTLVDGTLVATDWAELVTGKLRHAIDLTESRGAKPSGSGNFCTASTPQPFGAWSSTQADGTRASYDSCAGFTNGTLTYSTQIIFGDPRSTGSAWTASSCLNAGPSYCSKQAPIYCFEQ